MTSLPDDTGIALKYVREEFTALRGAVREDISSVRTSIDSLSRDLRIFASEQLPRIAVLERRADAHDGDIAELKAAHGARVAELRAQHAADIDELKADRADERRTRSTLVATLFVGLVLAVVSAVLAWLPAILGG